MDNKLKLSIIQFNASDKPELNLINLDKEIANALSTKPDVIVIPEMFIFRGDNKEVDLFYKKFNFKYLKTYFQSIAKKNKINLIAGSTYEKYKNKYYNTALIINRKGIIKKYRKIHLFDVELPDGTKIKESDNFHFGNKVLRFNIDDIKCGITICYDLRFPELFRKIMSDKKVKLIFVIANFTYQTGMKHWTTLLRARAIENQIFIAAANQTGMNKYNKVKSYGHSCIISPDGEIIKQAKTKPGRLNSTIDLHLIDDIRNNMPVLKHIKLIS